MERRKFFRDVLMTCAISLLPKVLQPQVPEVLEEDTDYFFEGILPTLRKHGNIYYYQVGLYDCWNLPNDINIRY